MWRGYGSDDVERIQWLYKEIAEIQKWSDNKDGKASS